MTSLGEWTVPRTEAITTVARVPLSPRKRRRTNLVVWLQELSLGRVVGAASIELLPSPSGAMNGQAVDDR